MYNSFTLSWSYMEDGFGGFQVNFPNKSLRELIFAIISKFLKASNCINISMKNQMFNAPNPRLGMDSEALGLQKNHWWLLGPGSIDHFSGQGVGRHWWKPEGFLVLFFFFHGSFWRGFFFHEFLAFAVQARKPMKTKAFFFFL